MDDRSTHRVDDVSFARSGFKVHESRHDGWIVQLLAVALGFLIGLGIAAYLVDYVL